MNVSRETIDLCQKCKHKFLQIGEKPCKCCSSGNHHRIDEFEPIEEPKTIPTEDVHLLHKILETFEEGILLLKEYGEKM